MDAFIELFDPLSMPLLFLVFGAAGLAFVFVLEFIVHRRMRPDVHVMHGSQQASCFAGRQFAQTMRA